jgi:hypothetical protein
MLEAMFDRTPVQLNSVNIAIATFTVVARAVCMHHNFMLCPVDAYSAEVHILAVGPSILQISSILRSSS